MRSLKRFLESKSFDAQHIEQELKLIKQYKHWKICGFKTLDAYLRAEVGITHKELSRRLAQDLAADPSVQPAVGHGGDRTTKQVDNVHLNKLNSNSAERIVRLLKRDAPAIAEALARGEFKSARAAGIAAGIVNPHRESRMNKNDLKTLVDIVYNYVLLDKDEEEKASKAKLARCELTEFDYKKIIQQLQEAMK
jgi:hypothetical protein